MSTLRVSNIEAKADVSSPSVHEKIKVTNSEGDVLVHIDGATSGISTVGINTTVKTFDVDSNQNIDFVGNLTAPNITVTGTLSYDDVTNIDSVGVVTARDGIHVTSGQILVAKTTTSITTQGSRVDNGLITVSGNSNSTNLAINGGGNLSLANIDSTDNNFSNIGGYNSNGLVVSQIDFINKSHSSRTGDIAFLTHNGSAMSERLRITSGGYIGINEANPTQQLHVHDDTNYQGILINGNQAPRITFAKSSSTTVEWGVGIDGTNGNNFAIAQAGNTAKLIIDASGKIGINDNTPDNALSIKGLGSFDADGNSFYFGSNFTGTGQNYIGSTKHAQRFFLNNASANGYFSYSNTGSAGTAGDAITWLERLRITSGGQVNIGGDLSQTGFTANITRNSNETDILRIKGNAGNAFIRFQDSDSSSNFTLGADDAVGSNGFALYDRNDSAYRLVVDTNGYLGINNTSPSTRLDVRQNNGVAYNDRAQSVSYGAARFLNESGHTSGGTYTGFQFNITGNSQNRVCAIGAISHSSSDRTSSLVFATDDNGNRTEKLRIGYNGNLSMPAGGAIYSTHSANTAITPSSNDWIDVARIPYGAEIAGEVIIRWANLHAPACCHHGHMRFDIGSSHGPTYNYQWSASLSMTEAQAHNSFWFKAARLIIQNISGSNYLYLQVQANTSVTSGTFRNIITRSKRTVDAGTHIEYLTPSVQNRTGTVARYLILQNAGSEVRVTTPHSNKIQNALGGNVQVEGSLNIGGHLSWGGMLVEKLGERTGTGTYTIFTNGNAVTQSAGIVEIMAIYGTPSGAGYWKYKITGNRNVYLMDSDTTAYGGTTPSLSWNGANLEVSNSNGNVYYSVHVRLFQIGIGWGETWGNLPGLSN